MNLAPESSVWSIPRDAGSRVEVVFCSPSQIDVRDWLRELLSVARKQLTWRNYFSTGVLFLEISQSFSQGTG